MLRNVYGVIHPPPNFVTLEGRQARRANVSHVINAYMFI